MRMLIVLAMMTLFASSIFAVEIGSPVPGMSGVVYSSEDGRKLAPAPGYEWANNKDGDFSVRRKNSSNSSRSAGSSFHVPLIGKCETCNGSRFVTCSNCNGTKIQNCMACNGTGNIGGIAPCMCGNGKDYCRSCNYIYDSEGSIVTVIDRASGRVPCPDCKGKGRR